MKYQERLAWEKGWTHGGKAMRKYGEAYAKEMIIHFLRKNGYVEAAQWIRKNYDNKA
jgi:hypothetical protein